MHTGYKASPAQMFLPILHCTLTQNPRMQPVSSGHCRLRNHVFCTCRSSGANEGLSPGPRCAKHVALGQEEHRAAVEAEARQSPAAGTAPGLPLHRHMERFFSGESIVTRITLAAPADSLSDLSSMYFYRMASQPMMFRKSRRKKEESRRILVLCCISSVPVAVSADTAGCATLLSSVCVGLKGTATQQHLTHQSASRPISSVLSSSKLSSQTRCSQLRQFQLEAKHLLCRGFRRTDTGTDR